MSQPDKNGPLHIEYDAVRHTAGFQISGWRGGKAFVVSGNVPLPGAPGLKIKAATDVIAKAAIKDLLAELIADL